MKMSEVVVPTLLGTERVKEVIKVGAERRTKKGNKKIRKKKKRD